ncbi:cobyric acid synthase [Candidatus Desantisbacteria bacterium]|nr:cobyric acid synthase [Candidatus Desantisbacteria bacterium]
MSKSIMIQGTGSGVGKSIIVTALCRIFMQDGYRVAPFKSQNMALNSGVTIDGLEMGRAQITQAEAAGINPIVDMNPILLKPTTDTGAQIIVCGKPIGNMQAVEYHKYKPQLTKIIQECFLRLQRQYEIIVIEGAGSPAEINLKDNDIVNMYMARVANAPVILIVAIDRGGAFAWIAGTMELLPEDERTQVKGIIINKFRGDKTLLLSGLKFLEDRYDVPILGVIPYFHDICIEEEDSLGLEKRKKRERGLRKEIEVVVVQLPHISNFTDFDMLSREIDVSLKYVKPGEPLGNPDMIILPGTKSTIADMNYLYTTGCAREILSIVSGAGSTVLLGICGGFQMLGTSIIDTEHAESAVEKTNGLGLLDITTTFLPQKLTTQIKAQVYYELFETGGLEITGYEIHMGQTTYGNGIAPLFNIISPENRYDGAVCKDGLIMGTYIHGLFDNHGFRRVFINYLRKRKGLPSHTTTKQISKEAEYDNLAALIRENVDMERIYSMLLHK